MTLHLPAPKFRKRAARAVQKLRDKSKYTRQQKHKAIESGGLMFCAPGRARELGESPPMPDKRPLHKPRPGAGIGPGA